MAAGLGFKTFNTGDVLSASDVNGYLMQGVLVFASTAARDAAITAPAEGQFAFTKDTNSLFYYDGAAWVASGATGDIEGVTAGTGISGGGTSGTVTITNSMATAIDAKGDLVVGTGADTFSKLTVGANGTTLVADSSEATGLKWATPAGGGKVLQVVNATTTTSTNITSASYVDTTITATITPTLATSKILVLISANVVNDGASVAYLGSSAQIVRGATALTLNSNTNLLQAGSANPISLGTQPTFIYYDSPATTSATTYKLQAKLNAGTSVYYQLSSSTSSITLMEIGV